MRDLCRTSGYRGAPLCPQERGSPTMPAGTGELHRPSGKGGAQPCQRERGCPAVQVETEPRSASGNRGAPPCQREQGSSAPAGPTGACGVPAVPGGSRVPHQAHGSGKEPAGPAGRGDPCRASEKRGAPLSQ
ncbi:collagen alpha-1(I) chain-like [Palaemon carinicauda]|uniref:collagen alpha-1(I) chain-like n=1 Tax=Palaemon carinicauda TaxID=392227 RepID=UPI0035B651B5